MNEVLKKKWGKPITNVQQFVPQEFVAACYRPNGFIVSGYLYKDKNGNTYKNPGEEISYSSNPPFPSSLDSEPTALSGNYYHESKEIKNNQHYTNSIDPLFNVGNYYFTSYINGSN